MKRFFVEFWRFGMKQVLCCVFPAAIFGTLAVSQYVDIPFLYRYDFILIVCLLVQGLMLYFKLESRDELKVICVFHLIGLVLEIYKVHMGSWSYPEAGVFKLANVPVYSGFMYASVASYICQAWKRFDLQFVNWPRKVVTYPIAILIYLNFFTHHFFIDLRWFLTAALFVGFYKSWALFKVTDKVYRMPVIASFFLIGFFIWIAENIATFFGAWAYPNQEESWQLVHLSKISSWFLLVIISVVIVVNLKQLKYGAEFKKNL